MGCLPTPNLIGETKEHASAGHPRPVKIVEGYALPVDVEVDLLACSATVRSPLIVASNTSL